MQQYIQNLIETMTWQSMLGVGVILIGIVAFLVIAIWPSKPLNFEILADGRMLLDERDEADEVRGIGAHSFVEAKVISLAAVRTRSVYPKGQITGDIAWNVQKALGPRDSDTIDYALLDGGDDNAA